MKNSFCFKVIVFALVMALMTGMCVFAAEGEIEFEHKLNCCHEDTFIKGYILNGIVEEKSEISLEGLNLSQNDARAVIEEVLAENSQATAGVESFEVKDDNVAVFKYDRVLSLYESAAVSAEKAKIISLIDDDMTDMEKALVVHDYMAQNYEYDLTYSIYSAEGMFENKKGVCQAYALAFIEIMKELSIECKFVPSNPMNHAWNLIKIDGEWYHIDITWDDPTPDLLGRVNHVFFLVSDDAIGSDEYYRSAHYGWTVSEKAKSTKYDGYFWYNVEKPIIDNGGFWYYIKETETKPVKGEIIKKNISTGAESVVYTIDDVWRVWDNNLYYWTGCFSGIGIMNNRIYFNTSKKIQSIKLDGSNMKTELVPNTNSGYIYGLIVSDGKITYGLSTSPNNGIESKNVHHIQYSIIFDGNGGETEFAYKNIFYGEKYGALPKASREGYTFIGWYTEKDGGSLVTENSVFTLKDDQTIYAAWEKIPTEIETKAEKTEGKCIVSVNPKWVDEECYIYVACFKEGKLSHIERRLYSGSEEKFTADDGSDVKIMLWGRNSLVNLCGEILIEKNEFEN